MAKQTAFNASGRATQEIQTVLRDADGREIVMLGVTELLIRNADGSVTKRKVGENLLTSCGRHWNPSMMSAEPIGCCFLCRRPPYTFPRRDLPTHGIVLLSQAKTCGLGCGRMACPQHARRCADGQYRCLICARWFWIRRLFSSLFFKEQGR